LGQRLLTQQKPELIVAKSFLGQSTNESGSWYGCAILGAVNIVVSLLIFGFWQLLKGAPRERSPLPGLEWEERVLCNLEMRCILRGIGAGALPDFASGHRRNQL